MRKHILPGIALSEPNPGLAFALWQLVKLFNYEERFNMYGEWIGTTYNSTAELRTKQAEADRETKDVLRRIAADNSRQIGRSMAKIAHSNPLIFFGHALLQIQNYSNMIVPVVESARYLSDLGYDVLCYVLVEALSRDKDRTKADGTNTSEWLLSAFVPFSLPHSSRSEYRADLATFAGSLFKRYDIRIEPVLRYTLAQIQRDNVQDLVVFRELLAGMTDVKAIDPLLLSDDQVRLLAGSTLLRTEVTSTLIEDALITKADKRTNVKSLARWGAQSANFCRQLVVRIALMRQQCVDQMPEPESNHVRAIASIFDQVFRPAPSLVARMACSLLVQTHLVLFQLIEYLELYQADSYEERVPSLQELIDRYDIEPAIAYHIARPVLRRELVSLPELSLWEKRDQRQRVRLAVCCVLSGALTSHRPWTS